MKIANKISLSFLITVLILTIIAGTIFYLAARDGLQKSIYNELTAVLDSRCDHIETYLKMLEVSVGQLSRSLTLMDFLKISDKESPERNEAFEAAMKRLASTKEANPAIAEFLLMDKTGKVVAASSESIVGLDRSMDSFFLGGQKETFIKDVYYSEIHQEPLMAVSAPILDSQTGELSGVLAARVRLNDLNNIVANRIGMGETGEIYIVNEYGYMITPSRFEKSTVLKEKVDSEPVRQARLHKDKAHILSDDKTVVVYTDYRGELVLGAHEYISQMRWSVIAEIDKKEAFRPLAKIRLIFLLILFIVPIAGLLLGSIFAKFIAGPINRLRKGSEIIGSGNLDYKVGTDARDEVGQLSRAFDTMMENLKKTTTSVEILNKEIDERKRAQDEIVKARDYTDNIIKSMSDTLIVINPDGKIRSINKTTTVLLGYKEEELIGKPFGTIVAEEEEEEEEGIPFIGTRLKKLIKEGFIKEYDMTYKTKSGEMIPVSFSGAVMRDKDGELIGIVCIGRDLRERKKMEDMLQNEKDNLTAIFASSPVGMLLLDEETVIVDASSAAAVMVLKDPAQIIQQRAGGGLNCIHSLENKKGCGFSIACPECPLRKGILQVLTTGSSIRGAEIQLTLMINGQEHRPWLRISAEPILLGGRKHVVVAIDDITESKKTEEALRESEERYHALFVESRDAMMTLLPGAGFLSGNPVAIRMFGCRDEKSFTSQSPASLSPKYQPDGVLSSDKAQEMIMLALEKGVNFFEWTHKRIDGTEFPATVLLSKVEKGGKAYLQATVRDITEHKRSEEALKESQEQLFQTSKLASLGQLSAGAAHEINNPLAGIVGFTEATLLDLKNERIAPERIAHDLKIILKNAERCKVIISNLLNFARAKELQRKESDINSLIDDAMALVEYKTAAQNIKVVRKYEKNPRKVSIDQDQMMQVLINVISNAQNAMPDGGELLVRTGSEDNFALIEVKDTGIGIEKENLLKVFDPFFTTREPGQGVGLGLSISHSIMKRHEGSIEAKSDGKNKGASFIIKIPV